MNTDIKSISEIFEEKSRLEVPFYQREYVWGIDEWTRFLEDMEHVSDSHQTYFLGSIIFKKSGRTRTIIDGQQRLTTWCIFVKVCALKTGDRTGGKYLLKDAVNPVIIHSKSDEDSYKKVLRIKKDEVIDDVSNDRIIGAYNFFRDNIDIRKIDFNVLER